MPLTPDDQVKYKSLYLQTAKPYINELQNAFTLFSQGNVTPEEIEIAHRAAHSLTSQSNMMSYTQIAKLASLVEKVMKAKVDNQLELTPEVVAALKAAADTLFNTVASIENDTGETDVATGVENLSKVTQILI